MTLCFLAFDAALAGSQSNRMHTLYGRCDDGQPGRLWCCLTLKLSRAAFPRRLQRLVRRPPHLLVATRTSRINALRGFCREFGLVIPQGSRTGVEAIARLLADPSSSMPDLIRGSMRLLVEETAI